MLGILNTIKRPYNHSTINEEKISKRTRGNRNEPIWILYKIPYILNRTCKKKKNIWIVYRFLRAVLFQFRLKRAKPLKMIE